MDYFIISEIVQVKVGGAWYEAEIKDISGSYAYVYLFDQRAKVHVNLRNVRRF